MIDGEVDTFVKPLTGLKAVTVGEISAATVVKDEVTLATSAVPATSATPLVPPITVIAYVLELASTVVGVRVAVLVAEL